MLNLFEAFAGIGAWGKALKRENVKFELVGFSEINKYAISAFCAIHNQSECKNYGDITKIDSHNLPQIDLLCASPPCQSFSIAGKQKGMEDDRGKLFLDTLRIVTFAKPKVILFENVKGLTFKKFEPELTYILSYLKGMGYNVYHKILDAKDFGIPQSRKRLFIVGIKGVFDDGSFTFPEVMPLQISLMDLLEENVPDKYYIKDKCLIYWNKTKDTQIKKGFSSLDSDVAVCQTARQYANWRGNYVTDKKLHCIGLINNQNSQGMRVYEKNISCTLSSQGGGYGAKTGLYKEGDRVRKLTPLECMRLMNFDDEDFYKLKSLNLSDTQLYRLCGNSIVVSVICAIIKNLKQILGGIENGTKNNSKID